MEKSSWLRRLGRGVAVNRFVLFYATFSELMVKVTDHKKGYWAEAPLDRSDAVRVFMVVRDWLDAKGWSPATTSKAKEVRR